MPIQDAIDNQAFRSALISGARRVIAEQRLLNKINVFPVADSDTGTNLSLTLGAVHNLLENGPARPLGELLEAVADTLLDNARGNSGAILAQFFQGFSDAAQDITSLTAERLAAAAQKGSDYAHDALSQPQTGTILSAIAAFAAGLERHRHEVPQHGFAAWFQTARRLTDKAVTATQQQMDVLQKAGVVDAGAKGFAVLIGGMADFFSDGHVEPLPESKVLDGSMDSLPVATDDASRYRYCTECLVSGDDIDRRKLREALTPLGDSLVLAGSKRKAKIHIHVDNPDDVFDAARRFGVISGEKADDMRQQHQAARDTNRQFAVITDSAADIPDAEMERLDIHMVPCRIQFGDHGYLDKVSISIDEFYHELATNPRHPTTSQPAPGDFRRQLQFLASHYDDVLSINLAASSSGTCEAARTAARRTQAADRITVIDSVNASVGQGQLVVLAAECAAAGFSMQQTVEIVQRQIDAVKIYALLSDLDFAVRGGRLPRWVRRLADVFNLVPVLTMKKTGRVGLAGVFFGQGDRIGRFARFVAARLPRDSGVEIAIGHAVAEDQAQELATALRQSGNIEKVAVTDLGTALGVHGGPGSLVVSAQPRLTLEDVARGID